MAATHRLIRSICLNGTALVGALALFASPAHAQEQRFELAVPSQSLDGALRDFARQSKQQLIFTNADAQRFTAPALHGSYSADEALGTLLAGTDLQVRRTASGVFQITAATDPQSGSAAGDGAEVEALIVTAQKREEDIQDVPIAISAFSQRALEEQKIEGGYDLLKAIPNVTFSKSNFSSYNFSIRGIGTKAISATTDPGVAVAFNNTTLIQNRLFEQEYFDIERVEVLRGPQGTLYGRNATAGVINVITRKADLNDFEASLKLEVGNYDTRRVVGMLNMPLVEDKLALRLAGSWTQRTGYDYNSVTENNVNGRDLWSGRVTVGFEPIERLRGNLTWEHFEEDDDRSRTGKQLCHRDPGPTAIGDAPLFNPDDTDPVRLAFQSQLRRALFSQSCQPGSLYDDAAFGTPNGLALPFVFGVHVASAPCTLTCAGFFPLGYDPVLGRNVSFLKLEDPYGGMMQSRDLRTIASFRDPVYRAKADLIDLTFELDVTDELTFTSQTVYNKDEVYSFQDYNRFNTQPVFTDTSILLNGAPGPFNPTPGPTQYNDLAPEGRFCDPQLGCSDTLAGFDISQASGDQFSQEFRLSSKFDGPVNFSVGANYTRFDTVIDYYVFYNIITILAVTAPFNGTGTFTHCSSGGWNGGIPGPIPTEDPSSRCPFVDPNPIDFTQNFEGDGHNYFRSKNPYRLNSAAAFGELYWNVADDLKVTAGLRYTDDRKKFVPVPSQVLLAKGSTAGGNVNAGYPEKPAIEQQWGEFTGRLGVDWKPVLTFTDETLLYGFYSRGYKGGGANPPSPGFATGEEAALQRLAEGLPAGAPLPTLFLTSVEYGRTFEPEFVNAFEAGSKNTLLDGAMTLNMGAFYYDYKDYQVSQIRDRTAVNENFDATVWGVEFETVFFPTRDLKLNANLGYLDTKIADGETSIDIMNRNQGDPNYVVVKPWVQLPSNCVVPLHVVENWVAGGNAFGLGGLESFAGLCGGVATSGTPLSVFTGSLRDTNPEINGGTGFYNPANYPELNGGAGIKAQLGGDELPNSPHWTMNVGAQYGLDIGAWRATARADAYWQSQSWARVYNAVNDKLHGWYNLNLSVWAEHEDWGLKVELYAKNVLNDTPITDAFLNSDDSGLTTNVFILDPRIIGLSVRKDF